MSRLKQSVRQLRLPCGDLVNVCVSKSDRGSISMINFDLHSVVILLSEGRLALLQQSWQPRRFVSYPLASHKPAAANSLLSPGKEGDYNFGDRSFTFTICRMQNENPLRTRNRYLRPLEIARFQSSSSEAAACRCCVDSRCI